MGASQGHFACAKISGCSTSAANCADRETTREPAQEPRWVSAIVQVAAGPLSGDEVPPPKGGIHLSHAYRSVTPPGVMVSGASGVRPLCTTTRPSLTAS